MKLGLGRIMLAESIGPVGHAVLGSAGVVGTSESGCDLGLETSESGDKRMDALSGALCKGGCGNCGAG